MELLKYVYFCAQKSIIKAGNNKFQDLINAPRISKKCLVHSDSYKHSSSLMRVLVVRFEKYLVLSYIKVLIRLIQYYSPIYLMLILYDNYNIKNNKHGYSDIVLTRALMLQALIAATKTDYKCKS